MLTVSNYATDTIRQVVAQPGAPDAAGLRIAVNKGPGSFTVDVAPAPQPGDTVLNAAPGASLFIAKGAAEMLKNAVIDARVRSDGRVQFVIDSAKI